MDYSKGIDLLNDRFKTGKFNRGGVAACVVGNAGHAKAVESQACHAGLGSFRWDKKEKPTYVLSAIQKSRVETVLSKDHLAAYVNCLVNESAYKDVFLEKDVDKIVQQEAFVADAAAPCNLLVGALIAGRRTHEMTGQAFMCAELIMAGVMLSLALMLGCCLSYDSIRKQVWGYDHGSGHMSLQGFSSSYVCNFLNCAPQKLHQPWNECYNYQDITNTWIGGKNSGPSLHQLLHKFKLEAPKASQTVNPFIKSCVIKTDSVNRFPLQPFVKAMAERYQHQILEEIGYAESIHSGRKSAV